MITWNVFLLLSFILLLPVIPVHSQSPTCECQQEFTGGRLDLVKAPGNQRYPLGDADPITGNYFILWQTTDPPTTTQPQHMIRTIGRIFNREGSAISSEFEFESTSGVPGNNYSLPAAVVYNSRAGGFLVAWMTAVFSNVTQQHDHDELRGALISSSGEFLMQPKKLIQFPLSFSVKQILYNRFANQYVILLQKDDYENPSVLFLQRLNASANVLGERVQISAAPGQIVNAQVRLDPNSRRYAVAWSLSQNVSSTSIRLQVFSQTLQRIGPLNVVANTSKYSTVHLVHSGNKKAFLAFWNDKSTFVRTISPEGFFLNQPLALNVSQYLTAVRTNPMDDGFIILRGRTPKITRLNDNLSVLEQVLYPSCQAGDRNHPDLLIYNPASREFLVVWTYSYWARDGGIEIHGRRLKAIPSGSCQ